MSFLIALRFLFEVATKGFGEVYPCLIGYAHEYPHHIGKLVGKFGLLAGFGRLVAIGTCHDTSYLAHLFGENSHIGQFAKVAHAIGFYPSVDLLLSLLYRHITLCFANQYILLQDHHLKV